MNQTNPIPDIDEILKPLIGLKAWGVHRGHSCYLVAEFGNEFIYNIKDQERIRGEFSLWIRDCAWHLVDKIGLIVACNDSDVDIDKRITKLEGLSLRSVEINHSTLNTVFTFDNAMCLSVFTNHFIKERISWQLLLPERKALMIGGSNRLTYEDLS